MDHKTFLKSLDVETRAALTQTQDRPGLKHLAAHFGWILLMGSYIAAGGPFWGLLLVPQGIALVFLFTLLHETVHFTPFKKRWLNQWVGHICSVLVLVPNQWFRYFHLAHHKHTNNPDLDPELESAKPDSFRDYLWHISALPYWASMARLFVNHVQGKAGADYLPERAERICVWQARGMVLVYVLALGFVLLGQSWIFWCWMLPVFLGQPFLRLYLLAEHGHCPPVSNMFENTRTTFTSRIIRFLAWNMPYHCEHHAYPSVPFHKLPVLHKMVREQLVTTSNGYARFHKDYLRDIGR